MQEYGLIRNYLLHTVTKLHYFLLFKRDRRKIIGKLARSQEPIEKVERQLFFAGEGFG